MRHKATTCILLPENGEEGENLLGLFETVTEEEVISLWQSLKSCGLSANAAWEAVVTGMTLDMAFGGSARRVEIEH